jgi:urease accessory protein
MRALTLLLSVSLIAIPTAALAHTGHGDTSGFAHGFMHPLGGLDHLLCMVAVGLFAAVLGGRALWLVPLSFVGMMIVGFLTGVAGVEMPFVELGIGLSAVVIGAVAASGRLLPVAGAMALVGVFAIFHGHAHGAEMPSDASGLDYALGFVAATTLLHLVGIGAALGTSQIARRHGRTLARVASGVSAMLGLGIVAGWL